MLYCTFCNNFIHQLFSLFHLIPNFSMSNETLYFNCNGDSITDCNDIYREITPRWLSAILATWQLILVLLGILGNGVVIFASTRYSTFNLDSVTVFFVQQLAIADLIYTVLLTTPCAITHIMRGWIFGKYMCYINGYLVGFLSPVNFFLTMVISLHRIFRCYYPMKMMRYVRYHAIITVIVIWTFSFLSSSVFLSYIPNVMPEFVPSYPLCYFNVESPNYPIFLKIHLIIFMGTPYQIIIWSNVLLLKYSREKTRDLRKAIKKVDQKRKEGFNTIYLISGLLIITWTPLIINDFIRSWFPGVLRNHHIIRVGANLFLMASCGNPIIYCFANPKFKNFSIKLMAKCMIDAKSSVLDSVVGTSGIVSPNRAAQNLKQDANQVSVSGAPNRNNLYDRFARLSRDNNIIRTSGSTHRKDKETDSGAVGPSTVQPPGPFADKTSDYFSLRTFGDEEVEIKVGRKESDLEFSDMIDEIHI